jgi:hypothetical protein
MPTINPLSAVDVYIRRIHSFLNAFKRRGGKRVKIFLNTLIHHHRLLIPLYGVGTACFLHPFSSITRHLNAHSFYFHTHHFHFLEHTDYYLLLSKLLIFYSSFFNDI